MFFCPNCNNTFDIARTKTQSGGEIDDELIWEDSLTSELQPDFNSDTPESDYYSEGGKSRSELLQRIIEDQEVSSEDIKNITLKDLTADPDFKKLKAKEKELVYNRIQDLLPKGEKKFLQEKTDRYKDEDFTYFVCNNCKYAKKIDEGTLIFSRTADTDSKVITTDMSDMIHNSILPRTRKYICPNDDCQSHKDPNKREAVFYRIGDSYRVHYLCTSCKTSF